MTPQLWSWLLTIVGLTCFWLAGKRVWWCWYIGLAGQVAWDKDRNLIGAGDVVAQARQALDNLKQVLAAADLFGGQ